MSAARPERRKNKAMKQFCQLGYLVLGLSVFYLSGCSTPKVQTSVELPARIDAMSKVKKLGIYRFENDEILIGPKIEQLFKSIVIDGEKYFEVLNRSDLDAIISEQKNANSILFDDDEIVELGQLAKVQTIITGQVQKPILSRSSYSETRSTLVCLEYSQYSCVNWGVDYYEVTCNHSEAAVAYQLRITNIETGHSVLSKTYQANVNEQTCRAPSSLQSLQRRVISRTLNELRRDIAPYHIWTTIELMESDKSDLSNNDEAYKQFKKGLAFIDNDHPDIRNGCGAFNQAAAAYGDSAAVYYNLGVCAELESDTASAKIYFEKAHSKLNEPSKLVTQALTRIEDRINSEQQLDLQKSNRSQPES